MRLLSSTLLRALRSCHDATASSFTADTTSVRRPAALSSYQRRAELLKLLLQCVYLSRVPAHANMFGFEFTMCVRANVCMHVHPAHRSLADAGKLLHKSPFPCMRACMPTCLHVSACVCVGTPHHSTACPSVHRTSPGTQLHTWLHAELPPLLRGTDEGIAPPGHVHGVRGSTASSRGALIIRSEAVMWIR